MGCLGEIGLPCLDHSGILTFASILSIIGKTYSQGASFYRARISADHKGFAKGEMGAPPMHKRTAGRINPEGIGVLYLSSDKITALNEARASAFDYVSIGEFKAARKIKLANLSGVGTTSPFIYSVELDKFAVNRAVFRDIAAEIAKPIRRSDSLLEYLPTQFISEFIKSQEFDGVEYASTLKKGGYNLAVFNSKLFECINVEMVEVSEILYETEPSLGTVK